MKLATKDIANFLKKPFPECRFFLIYGPDAGLASERAQQIAKVLMGEDSLKDPLQYVTVDADRLKDDPAWLADELNAYSFFGGKKLIRILDVGAAIPEPLSAVLEQDVENYVIVIGADLPATSGLRKAFEKGKLAVAIPCYREEERDITQFASSFLREGGYQIDGQALQTIRQAFYGNHLLLKSELEKLMLYCGDKKQITAVDIEASAAGMVELSLQDICTHTASGLLQKAQREAEQMMQEGMPAIAMLRALINYFSKLYEMRAEMADSGKNIGQVIDAQRPPVFFKLKPLYQQHLSKWSLPRLNVALSALHQAEGECKKTGAMNELLLSRILLKLGKMAA